jgi:dihydrofolate synthase/folylpolyglutamate synthase
MIEVYEDFLPKHGALSFFELSTCLAIYSFNKAGAEWCILEAGCGGRYDATNVIPKPVVAIITNINKDHTEILGNTLSQIAKAKAGITKKHGLVLCGEIRPSLKTIFQKEALKKDASLFFIPPPATSQLAENFGYEQEHNAALAIHAAREIGISKTVIERATKNLRRLPCRFETMQADPVVILDGAHSEAKMESTIKLIKSLDKPVRVLYGAVHNKDSASMLKALSGVATNISTTRFSTSFRKAAAPHELLRLVTSKKRGRAYLDACQALNEEIKALKGKEILVVTGSLYLSGELRAKWIPEKQILKQASSF